MTRIMVTIILVLVINIGFLVPKAAAQSDKYPKMAPVDQYLMERNAEIVLARGSGFHIQRRDSLHLGTARL
jgi:energy-converting hydrogenase Eha subunit F